MTCIIGLVEKDKVYIGGDSIGVDTNSYEYSSRSDRKVFVNSGFAFGFTPSYRIGQLLTYQLTIPKRHPDTDLMEFMVGDFIDAVRTCLKNGGCASVENQLESGGGRFMVGHAGRLFTIYEDYQVCEVKQHFHSVGCGAPFAVGAMCATPAMPAKKRILNALEIVEQCTTMVKGPFHIVEV